MEYMKKLLNVKVFFSSKTNKKKISQNMFWQKRSSIIKAGMRN